MLFAEGTSTDGRRVLPFRSAFFASAEIARLVVQPVTLAYSGHWGLPMTRRRRPYYAWYGDMELPRHFWQALATGPIEVTVIFHPPMTLAAEGGRKNLRARPKRWCAPASSRPSPAMPGAGSQAPRNGLDQRQQ